MDAKFFTEKKTSQIYNDHVYVHICDGINLSIANFVREFNFYCLTFVTDFYFHRKFATDFFLHRKIASDFYGCWKFVVIRHFVTLDIESSLQTFNGLQ